jgi:tetratricopeptide (TPR) repeat protein
MSPRLTKGVVLTIPARSLAAVFLAICWCAGAAGSDRDGAATAAPYVTIKRATGVRDLTREFVQRTPNFSLEFGGKRMLPVMPGLIYHGERLDGDRVLLEQRQRSIRGWAPVNAVVPVTEAEAYFSEDIHRYPRDSFAYLMRGVIRLEKGDCEGALADLNDALRREPKNVAALMTRAIVQIIKNRPDQGLADANKAVALDPRNCYALEQRAMIYSSLRKMDDALRDFDRALELGSRWVMNYVGRGMIYVMKGELDRAQLEMERALQIDPSCVQAFVYLAAIHLKRSDPDKALAAVNRAIQIDPEYGEAYSARAVINQSIGHINQAVRDLDQAVHIDSTDPNPVLNRAFLKVDLGDYKSALADADMALRLDPKSAESHHGRAWILATCPDARIRNGEQAIASAARACELAGFKNARFLSTLAIAYSETGDFASAVKWQESAIALLAANDPERREYGKLLDRYRAGKPYHRLGLLESLGLKSPAVAAKAGAGNVN